MKLLFLQSVCRGLKTCDAQICINDVKLYALSFCASFLCRVGVCFFGLDAEQILVISIYAITQRDAECLGLRAHGLLEGKLHSIYACPLPYSLISSIAT